MPKIVLKVQSLQEIIELSKKAREMNLPVNCICDAGKTQVSLFFKKTNKQVEPGTLTVCAIGPASAKIIDTVTGHLKLL